MCNCLDHSEFAGTTQSIFEAAGGVKAFLALTQAWHKRCLAAPIVSHAFSHRYHPEHTARLATYWIEAMGEPPDYSGKYGTHSSVVCRHSRSGEHVEMDTRAEICFAQALDDAGLPDNLRLRAAPKSQFSW